MLLKGSGGVAPSFLHLGISSEEEEEHKSELPNINNTPAFLQNGKFIIENVYK